MHKLCAKTDSFVLAFDHPAAFRTSNMVDRHMDPLDRWLFHARYFHGNWRSAQRHCRAWALFHNFLPYCPRTLTSHQQRCRSPVEKLNGLVYHDNWLHNLLISTSAAGCSLNHTFPQNWLFLVIAQRIFVDAVDCTIHRHFNVSGNSP